MSGASNGLQWAQPAASGQPELLLFNTLTGNKVPLISGGLDPKGLTWYTCGPTVYDSAHLGHAKNYVSGDIIRRVLEDYFGYHILLVMNVTDVEDKIVYRARRNYLLEQYNFSNKDAGKVLQDVTAAVEYCTAKQASKVKEAEARLQESLAQLEDKGSSRQREDMEDAVKDEQKKLENLGNTAAKLKALAAQGNTVEGLLAAAGDALAEHLDAQLGDTVTDLSIFRTHAARYEKEFLEDLDALGCRPPDVLTRVSEFIPEIITFIQQIQANGMAYEAAGSVYFDVQQFGCDSRKLGYVENARCPVRHHGHMYGKLHPNPAACQNANTAALLSGEAFTGDKRHPADFALWKAAKRGEPFWESPWGKGRPGWHIECSAMASSVIGQNMDIHSGGEDLRFPHHNNELAQSEAHYHQEGCHQWVNYFLHMGHLGIEGLKMSKSLKNFITIREALQEFTPRQLRLMFVLTSWDRKMQYGPQLAGEVTTKEALIRNFFANCEVAIRENTIEAGVTRWDAAGEAPEAALAAAISKQQQAVHSALCNNVDTGTAMEAVCELIRHVNIYLADRQRTAAAGGPRPQAYLLRKAVRYVTYILSCFGVVEPVHDKLGGLRGDAEGGGAEPKVTQGVLDVLTAFRDGVKALAKAKGDAAEYLALCDALRDQQLVELGVQLEDRPDGKALWKLEDPQVLRAGQAARAAEAAAAKAKKLQAALKLRQAELDKLEKIAALPPAQDALTDKYSKFDPVTGVPTHDKEGNQLDDKGAKKAKKDLEKQQALRAPLDKRIAEEGPGALDNLRALVASLQQEVQALQ